MGCTSAIVFACFGAAYGTAKAGVGVSAMGVLRPDLIVKSTSPMQLRVLHCVSASDQHH
jgi:V-type H+-transporting ATPase proteolipid subunit